MVNFGPLGAEIFSLVGALQQISTVSRFGFVTAATSHNGSQPNFVRCLAVSWAGTVYIHFRGFLPRNGICQVQHSFCVQVLFSPILAVLLHGYILATKAYIDNRKKNLLSSHISSRCLHNMVNFRPLATEICWQVWGTSSNFNLFCVLAALLHGTLVVGVSQTLRH